jgi:methylated-DNA-protein-cysteine methyltransferase-like protein
MDCAVKNKKGIKVLGKRRAKTRAARSSGDKSAPDKSSKTRMRIEAAIRSIPPGKVSTYGAIAQAAGLPGMARGVAQVLHRGFGLPWQRVLGAGGEIKLRGDSAIEQRLRLEAEGVRFRGRRVDIKAHEFKFGTLIARAKRSGGFHS